MQFTNDAFKLKNQKDFLSDTKQRNQNEISEKKLLNKVVTILYKNESDNNTHFNYFQPEKFEIDESFCLYKALKKMT